MMDEGIKVPLELLLAASLNPRPFSHQALAALLGAG